MPAIGDIMTRERLLTVAPEALVSDAARIASSAHVSHLPVIEHGALAGIVCVCDFEHVHDGSPVSECMNRAPVTVDVGMPAAEVAELMFERRINCVLVASGNVVHGIVTLRDLRRAGVIDEAPSHCASCGSEDHVRCARRGGTLGYCLDCTRRSIAPGFEIGGG